MDQALKEQKRGEDGNNEFEFDKKTRITREQKVLFRWNKKTSFIVFEGLSFGEK